MNKKLNILLVAVVLSFAISAFSVAEVTFNDNTFTGFGEYTQPVDAGAANLIARPDTGKTMTLSGGVVTTGKFTHQSVNGSYDTLIFAPGSDNSFGSYLINGHATTAIAGTVNVTGNVDVCQAQTSTLEIRDGANFTIGERFFLTQSANVQGIVNHKGGTVNLTTSSEQFFRIGHYPNSATYPAKYNLSGGMLNSPNTMAYVGWDSHGELNIAGGKAILKGIKLNHNTNTNGTLALRGGELSLGTSGVTKSQTNHSILLGQGTVSAVENHTWGAGLTVKLDGRSPSSTADNPDGFTTFNVDSGKTIQLQSILTGTGGIQKTSEGTLQLNGGGALNNYQGSITVKGGTLQINKQVPTNNDRPFIIIDGGTAQFSSSGTSFVSPDAQPWTFATGGGTLNFASGQNSHPNKGGSHTIAVVDNAAASAITGFYNTNGSNFTLRVGNGSTLNFSAEFFNNNGTCTLTKSGAGVMNFTGAYTANTSSLAVTGGTFNFNPPDSVNGRITSVLINGGTLIAAPRGGGQMNLSAANAIQFGENGGTLTSNGNLHFTGNTTVSTTVNSGETNFINGTSGLNLNKKNITFDIADNSVLNIQSRLGNTNNTVNKTGLGTLILSNENNFNGEAGNTINVQAGSLKIAHAYTLQNVETITVAEDALLDIPVGALLKSYALSGTQHNYLDKIDGQWSSTSTAITGNLTLADTATFLFDTSGATITVEELENTALALFWTATDVSTWDLSKIIIDDSLILFQPDTPIAYAVNYAPFEYGSTPGYLVYARASAIQESVPEPSSWALLIFGVIGILWHFCPRRKK